MNILLLSAILWAITGFYFIFTEQWIPSICVDLIGIAYFIGYLVAELRKGRDNETI